MKENKSVTNENVAFPLPVVSGSLDASVFEDPLYKYLVLDNPEKMVFKVPMDEMSVMNGLITNREFVTKHYKQVDVELKEDNPRLQIITVFKYQTHDILPKIKE